jgi:hypothetical protein
MSELALQIIAENNNPSQNDKKNPLRIPIRFIPIALRHFCAKNLPRATF